jgi:type 1 glutamine amidotransferase
MKHLIRPRRPRLYGLRCLVAACLLGMTSGAAPAAAPAKLAVLILSGQNNHDWKTTTPLLKRILESSGRFTVEVTEHPEQLTAASLARCDALVSNWNAWGDAAVKEWPEAARKAVLDFVRGGRGFVVVHAGSSSFYDWPEYQRMVGASWNLGSTGHGAPHSFYVQVADPGHPVTHGMRIFVTRDELWHRTGIQPGVQPLAVAFSEKETGGSGQEEPVVLAHEFGKGRCFNLVLGHDGQAMASAGFQALLRRGTEWAASGKVTIPVGDMALSAGDLDFVLSDVRKYRPGDRRDALSMLEYHAGCVANTPKAAATAERLANLAADAGATLEGRRFACRMLSLVGSGAQVPALYGLLADKDLSTYARFALERIPGEESGAALRAALSRASGMERVGLINSLAARRDAKAVPLLARAVNDPDRATVEAALEGLGRTGTEGALRILTARERAIPPSLRAVYARALLRCADGLAADGLSGKAKPVYRRLTAGMMPDAIRSAAFTGLVRCEPAQKGSLLLTALRGRDRAIRGAAIRLLSGSGDVKLIRAAAGQLAGLPADAQVQVLAILGSRGDSTALPAVTRAAASRNAAIRKAALSALGALGRASSVPVLVRPAGSADGEERQVAGDSLARLRGEGVDAAIAAAAGNANQAAQRVLIRALVARSARATVPALLSLAEIHPEARSEAVAAVGSLGGTGVCGRLLGMLEKAGEDDRAALESALAAICARARTAAPILAALPKAAGPLRASLIAILGTVGGTQALGPLREAAHSQDPNVQAAAVLALAAWPDAAPLDDLFTVAMSAKVENIRTLALRGIAQLAPLAKDRTPERVVEILAQAMERAERVEDRKALVSALGRVPCLAALRAAMARVKEPGLGDEAGLAALQAADKIWRRHPAESEEVARKFADSPNAILREAAASLLLKLSKSENLAIGATAAKPDGLTIDGASQGAQAAIDGNPDTYWDEEDNRSLYILRVQLMEPATVSALRIMGYQQEGYAPKDFEILCDDKVVQQVENARYRNNLLTVTFPATRCSTVELRITGYYGLSPAIRELEIYGRLPGSR